MIKTIRKKDRNKKKPNHSRYVSGAKVEATTLVRLSSPLPYCTQSAHYDAHVTLKELGIPKIAMEAKLMRAI